MDICACGDYDEGKCVRCAMSEHLERHPENRGMMRTILLIGSTDRVLAAIEAADRLSSGHVSEGANVAGRHDSEPQEVSEPKAPKSVGYLPAQGE